MKIYTKTGDDGTTGLFGGPRVRKDDPRIEAYGAVDELNAAIGAARAAHLPVEFDTLAARVQNELFEIGAELATPDPAAHATATLSHRQVEELEVEMDAWESKLAPLRQFILPGGTPSAAALHVARTICRRAERRLLTLREVHPGRVRVELLHYLNRLGDWLFVAARAVNAAAGKPDVPWKQPAESRT